MDAPLAHFDLGWVKGFIEITSYIDPVTGVHPRKLEGGLAAVHSPESDSTNLGNSNLHEGYWLKTHTVDKQKYFVFIPNVATIAEHKPGTSQLWHTFIVQHEDGSRYMMVPDSVIGELEHGVKGD